MLWNLRRYTVVVGEPAAEQKIIIGLLLTSLVDTPWGD